MALYNRYFYNENIRKYVIGFGGLFTDIKILRKNSQGSELHREYVPLSYSNKEKFIQRTRQDKNLTNKPAVKVPRMGFSMIGMNYAPDRKYPGNRKIYQRTEDSLNYFYNPVPYDLDFELYILTKTQTEGLQIIEQIVPFFTPQYTISMQLTDLVTYKQDIPISLVSLTPEDNFEGAYDDRRTIMWTLSFRVHGYLLGPERTSSVVLESITNIYAETEATQETITALEDITDKYPNYTITVFDGLEGDSSSNSFSDYVDVKFSVELNNTSDTVFTINDQSRDLTAYTISGVLRESLSSATTYPITVDIVEKNVTQITIPQTTTDQLSDGVYVYVLNYLDGSPSNEDYVITGLVIKV